MASQNGDSTVRRKPHSSKSAPTSQNGSRTSSRGAGSSNLKSQPPAPRECPPSSSSQPLPERHMSKRKEGGRPTALPTPHASSDPATAPAGFATGEDFIAFDFSDDDEDEQAAEEGEHTESHVQDSPGKGKGKGVKRSADEMAREDDGYANKKQRVDAASRLTPWAREVDWDRCRNLAEMLHEEVKAFVGYITPTPVEHEVRSMVVALIARAVQGTWPDACVLPFGSFETKLYLPLGDIDLVVQSPSMEKFEKKRILYRMAHILRKANLTDNVQVIGKARVPIIKFVTSIGRFAVDISLNQGNGVQAGRIVNRFLGELPALRSLVMIIKLFLSQRSMNEVYSGGLGSYAIVCMAVSFLQMHPKIRFGEIDPSENLGVLMMEFFELYGHHFNYDNTGISLRDGGTYFNKTARGWAEDRRPFLLAIEDPIDISNDISKSSYNMYRVRQTLAGAHEVLTTAVLMRARVLLSKTQGRYTNLRGSAARNQEIDNPSLLGSVLGVTQETLNHRRMVSEVYQQNILQNLLGLAPYRPIDVHEAVTPRSKPPSTRRSAKAVESAWNEADMNIEGSDGELIVSHLPSPEAEESRYSNRHGNKRRRLDTNGKSMKRQQAVFVADSDEELVVSPANRQSSSEGSGATDGRGMEARRAYWASKGMPGGGLEDSD